MGEETFLPTLITGNYSGKAISVLTVDIHNKYGGQEQRRCQNSKMALRHYHSKHLCSMFRLSMCNYNYNYRGEEGATTCVGMGSRTVNPALRGRERTDRKGEGGGRRGAGREGKGEWRRGKEKGKRREGKGSGRAHNGAPNH